jgi:hypothetical protein
MIRWMSTVRIAAGKAAPAMGFAKDMVEFGKKIEEAKDLFIEGSNHTVIMREI